MEYDKINNLLLSEDNEMSEKLSKFVTTEYVIYLIHIMKINQLDLKHPC